MTKAKRIGPEPITHNLGQCCHCDWCLEVSGMFTLIVVRSVAPTRAFVSLPREQSLGGSHGFRRLHRQKSPSPLPRQAGLCRSLPAHPPPTKGEGWHGLDRGGCQPLFLCPATPPRGGRDLSTCLVLSAPDKGGEAGHYRLRELVSATLWAVLPFSHCRFLAHPV